MMLQTFRAKKWLATLAVAIFAALCVATPALYASLPYTISDGDDLDPAPVMANFNELDGRFPVTKTRIASVLSSVIEWDTTVPASALPVLQGGGGSGSGGSSWDQSDPVLVRALETPFTLRQANAQMPTEVVYGGNVMATKGGAVFFRKESDAVTLIRRNSQGGLDDLMKVYRTISGSAGDGPTSGVAVSAALGYVICGTTRILKSISLSGESTVMTTVLDLSATYPASSTFGKMIVDRHGRYLYFPVLKGGVDSCRRRICRVDLLSVPISSSELTTDIADDAAGNDIVDLTIVYGGYTSTTATGALVIAQRNSAAAGGRILTVNEDSTGELGGLFNGTVTSRVNYAGTEEVYAMTNWRGRPLVFTYDATNLDAYLYGWEYSSSSGMTWLEEWSATAAASDDALIGAAATDGTRAYVILDSGRLAGFLPTVATGFSLFTPNSNVTVSAGNYESPSGIVWNGKQFIGMLNRTGSTTSQAFIF